MARIVHLALKVDNLDQATKFYEDVFGFRHVKTARNGQHVSRHMTDGNIDLALMVYDSEDAHEATLAGQALACTIGGSRSTTRRATPKRSSNMAARSCPSPKLGR